jgi:hypothetical protein
MSLLLAIPSGSGASYSLACSAGSYAVTGQTATLSAVHHYALSAANGSYSLTGKTATLSVVAGAAHYTLSATAGSYSLTGQSVTLSYVGHVPIAYALSCEVGAYEISGKNATLDYAGTVKALLPQVYGFKNLKAYSKKQETEEEKRLRREAQGIIARVKLAPKPEEVFDDAVEVVDQLKLEVEKLEVKVLEAKVKNRRNDLIRAQLAQEQLRAHIEEIDAAFVMFTMLAQMD